MDSRAGRWDRIHHPGHQCDDSWYTTLNLAADNLASLGTDVDCIVPLSMLMDGTLTKPLSKGKKGEQEGAGLLKLIEDNNLTS
jgi:hypothetical protein